MSSLVLRTCNSEKSCAECSEIIPIGEQYWSGPYKALCINCYETIKRESASKMKDSENDSHIVTGNCQYCPNPAIGVLWSKKVCAGHINQAITESV